METIIWYNGDCISEEDCIFPITDTGLTLGLGVFDTALFEEKQIVWANDHFKRLQHDCNAVLHTDCPLTFEKHQQIVRTLVQKNNIPTKSKARIRTQITAGPMDKNFDTPSSPQIIIRAHEIQDIPHDPIKAWIVTDYPRIAGCLLENCKRIDYTRAHSAMQTARSKGGNEAIVTNTEGDIACATTSSLFIVEGDTLITPPLSAGILDSISRRKIIGQHNAKEENISIERLKNTDSAFLSNSIGMKTIMELEGKTLPGPKALLRA